MSRDIVIVPTHNRPEFLALCLEHLAACPEIATKDVWVRPDSRGKLGRYWSEMWEVVDKAPQILQMGVTHCPDHSYTGNSFNVLTGYKEAYDTGAQRVYMVEDDVLVSPDFFRWHDAMLSRHPYLFCSVGWHCLRRADVPRCSNNLRGYFLSAVDYASIGVCWPRESLGQLVAHVGPAYFDNPIGYIKSHFPKDPLSTDFSEQDGLIMRVLCAQHTPVAWPLVRRCSHVGWYGYHRPDGPKLVGEIVDKIAEARRIVSDPELLRKCGVRFGGDTEAVIPACAWKEEELHQCLLPL